jgi:hypothetical protein|tara:strand:- start:485 stop:844 length:360 start_codon:yes stop_codon:yes gene_type:complete
MPLYDLKCPMCELEYEGFATVDDKDIIPCPRCLGSMSDKAYGVTQVTCKAVPEVYGHYDSGLGSYIGSKKDESRIKKEKNLEELSPYETISTTHGVDKEKEIKKTKANDYIEWYSADNA